MSNEKPFQQFYRKQLTGSYFKCLKCKDTCMRLDENEYVICDCEAGKAYAKKWIKAPSNPSELLPMAPSEQKFSHELEKPLYSPAFAPSVERTDAEWLRAIAATMSYNAKGSEPDYKHKLYEIAMRLETGFYTE